MSSPQTFSDHAVPGAATPQSAPTVSQSVARALEAHVTDAFALMGNGNAWFLDALVRGGLVAVTTVRHEQATVAAADAYFRASGRIAVATTTYGPGFTNAITPLAEAAQARIPLVFVVGDAPASGPRPWDIDQAGVASAIGAPTLIVDAVDPFGAAERAVRLALESRAPVVLAIPYDLATVRVLEGPEGGGQRGTDGHAPSASDAVGTPSRLPSSAELEQVAALLREAARPLVIAGRGAWLAGAGPAIEALAGRIGARTATSAIAQGIVARDRRHLGVTGGFASERSAAAIERADVVLVVGAGLNQFQTRFGDAFAADARIVQVDVLDAPTNPRVDRLLQGDARGVVEALGGLLPADQHGDAGWASAGFEDVARAHDDRPDGDARAADGRLDPRSLFRALDRLLPSDRVVVQDGGHFIGWAPTYLTTTAPDRLLMVGTAFQTIGLGLPSAVGAGVARPDALTVLVTGDGGCLMGLADLDSVVRAVRRGVVVVCNDAAYGAEVHQYAVRGVAESPMLIDEVDFAAVGTALGATGAVITDLDDLRALQAWLESGEEGVFVADCRVSREVVAPYMAEVVEAAIRSAAAATD